MMIYSMQNLHRVQYKITVSKIELYFIKIFSRTIISCNSFWWNFSRCKVLPWQHVLRSRKIDLKFGMHDYSTNCVSWKYCRKWILNFPEDGRSIIFGQNCLNYMHNKCSQADIAHNSVDRSPAESLNKLDHSNKQTADPQAVYGYECLWVNVAWKVSGLHLAGNWPNRLLFRQYYYSCYSQYTAVHHHAWPFMTQVTIFDHCWHA